MVNGNPSKNDLQELQELQFAVSALATARTATTPIGGCSAAATCNNPKNQ